MNSRLRMGLLVLLLFLICAPAWAQVGNLTDEELQQMVKDGVPVIDIRRPGEWDQTGVVAGSHLMTFFDQRGNYDLDAWLRQLEPIAGEDDPFILVCRTGNRTGQVGDFLQGKLKYNRVYHLEKGITHWIAAGLPVKKPTK